MDQLEAIFSRIAQSMSQQYGIPPNVFQQHYGLVINTTRGICLFRSPNGQIAYNELFNMVGSVIEYVLATDVNCPHHLINEFSKSVVYVQQALDLIVKVQSAQQPTQAQGWGAPQQANAYIPQGVSTFAAAPSVDFAAATMVPPTRVGSSVIDLPQGNNVKKENHWQAAQEIDVFVPASQTAPAQAAPVVATKPPLPPVQNKVGNLCVTARDVLKNADEFNSVEDSIIYATDQIGEAQIPVLSYVKNCKIIPVEIDRDGSALIEGLTKISVAPSLFEMIVAINALDAPTITNYAANEIRKYMVTYFRSRYNQDDFTDFPLLTSYDSLTASIKDYNVQFPNNTLTFELPMFNYLKLLFLAPIVEEKDDSKTAIVTLQISELSLFLPCYCKYNYKEQWLDVVDGTTERDDLTCYFHQAFFKAGVNVHEMKVYDGSMNVFTLRRLGEPTMTPTHQFVVID